VTSSEEAPGVSHAIVALEYTGKMKEEMEGWKN